MYNFIKIEENIFRDLNEHKSLIDFSLKYCTSVKIGNNSVNCYNLKKH